MVGIQKSEMSLMTRQAFLNKPCFATDSKCTTSVDTGSMRGLKLTQDLRDALDGVFKNCFPKWVASLVRMGGSDFFQYEGFPRGC